MAMVAWWLLPAAAFLVTLVGDAWYVATRSLAWWHFSAWSLFIAVASGFIGLLLWGWRSPAPPDETAASRLESAAVVLVVAALVNGALALAMRLVAAPTGAVAWLAVYLTGIACLLLLAAGGAGWRARRSRHEHLRITLAPDRERVRR